MAGFFDTLFSGGAEKDAAQKIQQQALQTQTQSLGALKDAYAQETGYGTQAVSAYAPLTALGNQYAPATQMQLDALGLGGPEGTQRAQTAMMATPGVQTALDIVNRRRAGAGMGNSGNTDIDLANYVTGQLYPSWMQGVTGAAQMGGSYLGAGAQGAATGYTNLANLANQYGMNQTGVFNNYASTVNDATKFQAAGQAAGAKNLLGAGLSLASLALGMPPMGMGGGGGGQPYNIANSPIGQATQWVGNQIGPLFAPSGGYTGFLRA